ncbi:MAG: hypothetical protein CVV33_06875, partial [Methanomicrobiales archaeon HGW-Methanomicrobiales-4]
EAFILILSLLLFIQIATMVTFRKLFGKISPSISFPLSLLLLSFFGFYGTFFHIPPQFLLVPFIASVVYAFYRSGLSCVVSCFDTIRIYILYIISFSFMSVISAYSMVIGTSENVTDLSILMSLWRDPVIPPHDVWLGGIPLDVYYYLSHLLFATISHITGISPDIIFSLAIPTVFAATIMGLYSLSELFLERFKYLPLLTILVPNGAFFVFLLSGKALNEALHMSIWVITNTVNEYPYYSFVMAEFHAHSMSLFNQVLLLVVLCLLVKRWNDINGIHRIGLASVAAFSFGAMFPFNTWEVAIYGPGIFLAGYWAYRMHPENHGVSRKNNLEIPNRFLTYIESGSYSSMVIFWVFIPVLSIVLYLPYHIYQHSVYYGLQLNTAPSEPVQFLLLFGPIILALFILLRDIIWKKPIFVAIPIVFAIPGYLVLGLILMFLCYFFLRRVEIFDFLAILGLWALFVSEIITYSDRFNTVFKFQYCAALILGLLLWVSISRFLQNNTRIHNGGYYIERGIQGVCIIGAIVVALLFAVSYGHSPSIDALSPLAPYLGGDSDAILFLRSLPGEHVIVELSNRTIGGYHPYGRISSFSGVPAAVGWWSHEIQWRRLDPQQMDLRVTINNEAYKDPNRTLQCMDYLKADLLYVGTQEKKEFQSINLPKEGLNMIYDKNGVYIFERIDKNPGFPKNPLTSS